MENSYDYIAEQWHANPRGQVYIDRVLSYVNKILKDLPTGAKVLDLGCGTGNLIAKHIISKGFSVVGIDQSKKMLEIAKNVVPEAELIHGNIVEVEFNDKFAAAVAWDSIFHIERKYHSGIFQKVAAALKSGGKFLLSIGGSDARSDDSDSEGFTSEMFGHTFFYSGYDPQTSRRLLETAGFELRLWEIDDPSSRGHIAVIAEKIASDND